MARILVVDDEVNLVKVLREVLTQSGHTVECVHCGSAALQAVRIIEFDLIITDLIMPEKEGIELIMDIRKDFPKVKLIAMSGGGFGSPHDYLSFASALGASLTLTKPFGTKELLAAVDLALSRP